MLFHPRAVRMCWAVRCAHLLLWELSVNSGLQRGIDLTEPWAERLSDTTAMHIYSPSIMTIFICGAILVYGSLLYVTWAGLPPWRVYLRRGPRQVINSNESFFHSDLVSTPWVIDTIPRQAPRTGTQRQNDGRRAEVSCGQCEETNSNDHAAHCQTQGLE